MNIQNHNLLKTRLEELVHGRTRAQAAHWLGISENSLYKYLSGTRRPPDWLLDRLGLCVSYTALYDFSKERNKEP